MACLSAPVVLGLRTAALPARSTRRAAAKPLAARAQQGVRVQANAAAAVAGAATLLAAGESRAAELVSALPVEVRDTGSGGPEQQQAAQQPQESQPPSWGLHPLLQPAVDWAECFGGECEAPHGVAQIADVTPVAYGAFLVFFLVIASATYVVFTKIKLI